MNLKEKVKEKNKKMIIKAIKSFLVDHFVSKLGKE